MKIHCFSIVKDEADVLGFTLDAALDWADSVHVCDNGSTDGTLDLIRGYHERHPDVVSYSVTRDPYSEELRSAGVRFLQARAAPGDWWCKLDSDELYLDDPKAFLAGVGDRYGTVSSASLQFYLTELDLDRGTEADPEWHPGLATHYLMNWSEIRFVRHQPGVAWTGRWPDNMRALRTFPKRIRLLHYQYRTPEQVGRRISSRQRTAGRFTHEKAEVWVPRGLAESDLYGGGGGDLEGPTTGGELWRTRVVRSEALRRWDPTAPPEVDERLLPPLRSPRRGLARIASGAGRRLLSLVRP